MTRRSIAYALTYMALSIAIEVVLLVVVRLRIPQDNRIIAPTLLLIAPIAAAFICGHRQPRVVIVLAFATVALTLALVMAFGRITGISTGLAAPIVLRTLAGYLAARATLALGQRRRR